MPLKKRPEQSKPRPDLNITEKEFVAHIERPNLERNRTKFVIDGYARGLPLESLLQGSGFTPKQLFEILGLDEVANHKAFERLTEIQSKRYKP